MAEKETASRRSSRPALAAGDAIATLAVRNVKAARKFYEDTLGLRSADARGEQVVTYATSGEGRLFVYQSEFAGSNKATAVTWVVDDVDAVVGGLRARGVTFEHYDMPGMTREGDVHVAGRMRAAWFKDPDGNILAIVNAG